MSHAPVANSSVQKGFLLLAVSIVITLVISANSLHFYIQRDAESSGECKSCDIDQPTYFGDDRSYVALCLSVKGKHHRQQRTSSLLRLLGIPSHPVTLVQFADEPDIREWIWHHYSIGVKYFYIFDTGSAIPLRQHIQDFIEAGLVQYTYLSSNITEAAIELAYRPGIRADNGRIHWQGAVYNTCLRKYGYRHTFIGFIDADEFIIVKSEPKRLDTFLQPYEEYGGLVVNWVPFGSSGIKLRPEKGVLSSYTRCKRTGATTIKSFVVVNNTKTYASAHHFEYKAEKFAVDVDCNRVNTTDTIRPLVDKIALHHYITRSYEDFSMKQNRGGGMGIVRNMDEFEKYDLISEDNCTDAVESGGQVMASLARIEMARLSKFFC